MDISISSLHEISRFIEENFVILQSGGGAAMEKEKKEKYMANFKVSKAAVKVWEGKFVAEHGRRPGRCHASPFTCHLSRDRPSPVTLYPLRDDIRVAPDKIQLCYKNIAKIKAFFDEEERRWQLRKTKEGRKDEQRREEEQGKEEEPSMEDMEDLY